MKTPQPGCTWFFVDESGDPTFYDRQGNPLVGQAGCSPILILGFVETQSPEPMRQAVMELQQEVMSDPYFQAQFVVARKIERVFRNSFQAKETAFYDHLVTQLFQSTLHRYDRNFIYFAKRGSRNRQAPLSGAIRRGIECFEQKWDTRVTTTFTVQAQTPQGEPYLSASVTS